MKCPECSRNHRAKEGMNCACGYRFVFNPKKPPMQFTDGKFLAAIRRAGQNGTCRYTFNQLYAAYALGVKSYAKLYYGLALGAGVLTVICATVSLPLAFLPLLFCVVFLAQAVFNEPATMDSEFFELCVDRWLAAGRELPGVIDEPTLHQPPPDWSEDDIYDYGVERILLVDRDILVDLLVLNNQHAEQRMLVISENGYPEYLRAVANRLIGERPDLPVCLLHDADSKGRQMKQRITKSNWLQLGPLEPVDLGFTAQDFSKLSHTSRYEPGSRDRELPVDALLLPHLQDGLGQCFHHDLSFHELLQRNADSAEANISFG